MTALTDAKAITPTTTARSAAKSSGTDADQLMTLLRSHLVDIQLLVKQIIALTPTSETALLTSLNTLLSELL